jgi:hypothetical protein
MKSFSATIDIIGINPFVEIPELILQYIFGLAGKDKSPISVKGAIDGHAFTQTLMKYKGLWRLYINTPMLKNANKNVGDEIKIELTFDTAEKTVPMHPKLTAALEENLMAKQMFDSLNPSLQKEIKRYIQHLKTEKSVDKNVSKAILFLTGNERWIGRDGLKK